MKKGIKIFLIIAGVISFLVIVFVMIGALASPEFKGSRTKTIAASNESIWNYLNAIDSLPQRRKEIIKVEKLGLNMKGLPKWKEYTDMEGYIIFEMIESIPPKKLILQMVESTFGMSGTWTYELKSIDDSKTEVTITENSRIEDVFVRSIMTLAGRDANLEKEFDLMEKFTTSK